MLFRSAKTCLVSEVTYLALCWSCEADNQIVEAYTPFIGLTAYLNHATIGSVVLDTLYDACYVICSNTIHTLADCICNKGMVLFVNLILLNCRFKQPNAFSLDTWKDVPLLNIPPIPF